MFRYGRASCNSGWPTKKALKQRFVMVTPDEKVVAPPKKTLEQCLDMVAAVKKVIPPLKKAIYSRCQNN